MAASRKDARDALAALFVAHVTKAEAIYPYQKSVLDGQSPVVSLTSSSSTRERLTMRGSGATFIIEAHVFVLQRTKDGTWLEQLAENLLDDIEQQICACVDQHQRTLQWANIRYAEPTDAREPITLDGNTYLYERIALSIVAPQ